MIEGYEVFKENPVRIIIDNESKPLFCGYDIAKLLGYKNPSIAIHDACPSSRLINYYKEDYGKVQHLNFITEEDAKSLIRKRVANVDAFITSLLNGEVPEQKKGFSKHRFAVVSLEKEGSQIIEVDGKKYKITVENY